ncbi:OBAP family protein [Pseudomonas sp. Ant30-3]|uniref:OBAP family protein n=1 Tax=Pseudomonas sp. Ant30-3 TaxID=1488328 RepID=UPI00067B44C7|nr:OBAP family protein [Pseudomonas sp. Ant30-3]
MKEIKFKADYQIASRTVITFAVIGLLTACAGNNTASKVLAPGEAKTSSTKTLEAGAALLQSRPPIEALNAYLDGFHFYNGHRDVQMEAHHYCSILNEEVIQCVIYDGNRKDAKLMGVEYIISKQLFARLPGAEKALWHSHVHEVKSGQLIAPGIPEVAEHALMEKLVNTYGKTWHTWHTDLNKELPLGVPQLMMGFTADGQADPKMVRERDNRFGINSSEKKKARADIPAPDIDAGADAWSKGNVIQLDDPTGSAHLH